MAVQTVLQIILNLIRFNIREVGSVNKQSSQSLEAYRTGPRIAESAKFLLLEVVVVGFVFGNNNVTFRFTHDFGK